MKKTNLTRKLMAACSIVALSAVMYGCSSSGEDEAQMNADMYKAQLDALNAAAMAELGEGESLTPEAIAAIIAARDAAVTARMDADAAAAAAAAAQMTAEGERDAANMAAAAAAEAQATAEAARDAADMAAAAAAEAQGMAEGERDAANMAAAAAAEAQATAEGERDAANMAAAAAAEAQATAEGERDAANMAAAAAAEAQATAEGERDAANMAAAAAAEAQATAEAARDAADMAAAAAAEAQGMAEGERDAANMAAAAAAEAQATAEGERDAANTAAAAAAEAQATAEGERDAANMAAAAAAEAQATAEGERDAANMAAAAAAEAQATAEGERDAANTAAVAAAEAQMTAEGERDAANTAAAAAETARLAAVAAQTTAEEERDAAVERADAADAAVVVANKRATDAEAAQEEAEDELAQLREDAADALAAAAEADRIARADRIITAIGKIPGGTAQATPAGDANSGIATPVIKRDVAGMMTVDVNGEDDDDYAGGESTAGSGNWNSFMLTKTNDEGADTESSDIAVIYTDIDAPSDKKFNEQYDRDTRDDILDTDDRVKLASSSNFPSGATQSLTYSADSGNPTSFTGTFDGVSGTFECTAGAGTCTLMTNADGELQMAEGWRFTPNDNLATVKDPDAGYAWFGWWLNKPKDNDNAHGVQVFAGGTTGHAANIGNAIEGTASYSGVAAGKYATRTFTAGVQTDAAAGHFTANANLKARFAEGDELGTGISGSVSGFMLDDTMAAPWSVTLEMAEFEVGQATFSGTTEVNFGGGATDTDAADPHPGAWQGSFYGAADDAEDAPDAVAGTFGAEIANASVVGGFGATKQ